MQLILEDFVPYEQSSLWKIHDSYFAQRGGAAWSAGEIPSLATSSYAMARQQAKLLVALVRELEGRGALTADEPVRVLEVGSGSGKFAAMFLRALERGCGERGRALLGRTRYLITDYSAMNLRDALAHPDLAPRVTAGLVTGALLDLRRPHELATLDGAPIHDRFAAVIANYVCCVLPLRTFKKSGQDFFERRVRIALEAELASGETPEGAARRNLEAILATPTAPALMAGLQLFFDWAPVDLARAFASPETREVIASTVRNFPEATVQYPTAFLDFTLSVRDRLVPGGVLVVNDYGTVELDDLEGERERRPAHYGNTLNHGVDFPIFDVFCKHHALDLVRTTNPLFSVHTAAIGYGAELSPEFRKAFRRIYVRNDEGLSLLELQAAADAAVKRADHGTAARLYERCVRLEPDSSDMLFALGENSFEAGQTRLALRCLLRGRRLDRDKRRDFDFALGRVYMRLHRFERARRAFERSVLREDDPSTRSNLGRVSEILGDREAAFRHFCRSLELAPQGPVAAFVVRKLVQEYLPHVTLTPRTTPGDCSRTT